MGTDKGFLLILIILCLSQDFLKHHYLINSYAQWSISGFFGFFWKDMTHAVRMLVCHLISLFCLQVGYIVTSCLLNENHDFLRLVINTVRNDIIGRNETFQCLALTMVWHCSVIGNLAFTLVIFYLFVVIFYLFVVYFNYCQWIVLSYTEWLFLFIYLFTTALAP